MQQQGVVTKKKSTAILQIVTLTAAGGRYDALFLSNFATLQLHDKLARVPGVGDVTVFGIGQYSMRIWLDPQQMLQRSLMPSDVINAVRAQNAYVAAGQVSMPPTRPGEAFQLTIDVEGNLTRSEEFEDIIVKTGPNGQITRIKDVGRVELGAQTYSQSFKMNDRVAGGIAIYQLPDANALDTAARVRTAMATFAKDFPRGPRVRDSVRHDDVREGVGARGVPDAVRGGDPGADRDRGVPAGLAGDAGAGDDGAGDDHRGVRGDGGDGVFDQPADAVRGGAWPSGSWWTTRSWWWRAWRSTWSTVRRRSRARSTR